MKTIIKLTLLMCLITSSINAQKLKVTGGVNFMDINYSITSSNTDNPIDDTPITDTDITTKFSSLKTAASLNSSSLASINLNNASSETGFYLGLALTGINLSDKLEVIPEARFVAVKNFNQIQVPVLVSYNISEKFKAQAGPSLGFLLDTGDGMKSTNFAIDFGVSYSLSEDIELGARYDWGQTNLLESGDSDNYLKINNLQIGISYQFGN
ncbi:outer membrane beta-barrel protein [Seonamhaeicola marinus]|nr:outer membrane beta-barrel protein [Seonamhaeicola marinus]